MNTAVKKLQDIDPPVLALEVCTTTPPDHKVILVLLVSGRSNGKVFPHPCWGLQR